MNTYEVIGKKNGSMLCVFTVQAFRLEQACEEGWAMMLRQGFRPTEVSAQQVAK